MPDEVDAPDNDDALTPEAIANASFHTAFRGFDPVEVRAYLSRVADVLRAAEEAASGIGEQVSAGPVAAEPAQQSQPSVDPEAVVAQAVAEAEEILRDARLRAKGMEEDAVADGRRLVEAAKADAASHLEEAHKQAEAELRSAKSRARAEVGREATRLRAEAERSAAEARVDAERQAAKLKQQAEHEAAAIVEAARERGREMVVEAQAARERMLTDLARRKRSAQAQIEQLRAGRDRLLETLKSARRSVDEITLRFDAIDAGEGRPPRDSDDDPEGQRRETRDPSAVDPAPRRAAGDAGTEDRSGPPPEPDSPSLPALPEPTDTPSEGVRIIGSRPTIDAPRAGQARPAAGESEDPPTPVSALGSAPAPARSAEHGGSVGGDPQGGGRKPERRSSALRILRRARSTDRDGDEPTPPEGQPRLPRVEPPSSSEGVRILAPEAGEAGDSAAAGAARASEPNEAIETNEAARPNEAIETNEAVEPEAVEPEAVEPAAEGEPAVPADSLESVEPAAEGEPAVPADSLESVEPAPVPEPDGVEDDVAGSVRSDAGVVQPEEASEERGVDDIFARIRAEREAATAAARQVLATEQPDASTSEPGDPAGGVPLTTEADAATSADEDAEEQATNDPGARNPEPAVSNADEAILQRRDGAVAELEESLTRRLKRTLQDEQNAALDNLRTHRGALDAAALLGDLASQSRPYQEVAATHLEPAARAGAASSPMGSAAVAVDDLAEALARDLAESLRQRLDRALIQAAEEDLEVATIAERVNACYREWKTQRIERLTLHYVNAAFNRGIFLATPEGTPLRWLVDDEGPCPDCDDNALAGPTPRGQSYPTGQLLPPAHLGCRCLLVQATT